MNTNDNNRPSMGAGSGLDHADCEHVGPLLFTIMGKAPAFQFYSSDFLTGTMLMSNAEVGLYIRLLCLQAEHGPIPDDVERIVQAFGEPSRILWPSVRRKFAPGPDAGTLVNKRLLTVLLEREAFRKSQSEKGKKSAASRTNRGSTTVEPLEGRGRVEDRSKEEEMKEEFHEPEIMPPGMSVDLFQAIKRWEQYRKELKKTLTPSGRAQVIAKCEKLGDARAIAAIDHSIAQGWTGMYEPKEQADGKQANDPTGEIAYNAKRQAVAEANAKYYRERDLADGH